MSESKAGFRFWWFFFSLNGRVTRVPFAGFVLSTRLGVEAAAFILSSTYAVYLQTHGLEVMDIFTTLHAGLGLISLALLWPQFAVITKRLHDIALPMWIGLLWFLPRMGQAFAALLSSRPWGFAPPLSYTSLWLLMSVVNLGILAGVVLMSFIPGTKGRNRYGPHPHRRDPTAADQF